MNQYLLFALIFGIGSLFAQNEMNQDRVPPVAELPASVVGEAGKVSLVADFSKKNPSGGIDVYFINRSDQDIQISEWRRFSEA